MSDWFFMLGEPLSDTEREQARGYLKGLAIGGEVPIADVPSFARAASLISRSDWDRRWWDAEQKERERLRAKAAAERGDGALLQLLSQSTEDALEAPHGAAAV